MTLDRAIIKRAAAAWLAANEFVTAHNEAGAFTGETADAIIAEAVGPHCRATSRLYRAYEREVYRLANVKPSPRRDLGRMRNRNKALTEVEREDIRRRLRSGQKPKAVAKAVGRSIPMVYMLRRELA